MNPQRKTVFRDILDVLCFAKTLRKTLVNSVEKNFFRFAPPPRWTLPEADDPATGLERMDATTE